MYESVRLTNPGGKMWHIGLDESDIAKHVILPGDPARCEMIAKLFDSSDLRAVSRGNPTYTGSINNVGVSVMATGMGGTAVAIAVEELKHIGAKTLIRMGTCGALQRDIPEGSIVICTGAVRGDGTTPEYIPLEYPAIADIDVVCALRDAALELGVQPILGLVRSHDAFYIESPGAHMGWEQRIRQWTDANVKCIENEASTLFVVSSLLRGLRAGCILMTGKNLYDGYGHMATSNSPDYPKRVELMTQITLLAIQKLDKLGDPD